MISTTTPTATTTAADSIIKTATSVDHVELITPKKEAIGKAMITTAEAAERGTTINRFSISDNPNEEKTLLGNSASKKTPPTAPGKASTFKSPFAQLNNMVEQLNLPHQIHEAASEGAAYAMLNPFTTSIMMASPCPRNSQSKFNQNLQTSHANVNANSKASNSGIMTPRVLLRSTLGDSQQKSPRRRTPIENNESSDDSMSFSHLKSGEKSDSHSNHSSVRLSAAAAAPRNMFSNHQQTASSHPTENSLSKHTGTQQIQNSSKTKQREESKLLNLSIEEEHEQLETEGQRDNHEDDDESDNEDSSEYQPATEEQEEIIQQQSQQQKQSQLANSAEKEYKYSNLLFSNRESPAPSSLNDQPNLRHRESSVQLDSINFPQKTKRGSSHETPEAALDLNKLNTHLQSLQHLISSHMKYAVSPALQLHRGDSMTHNHQGILQKQPQAAQQSQQMSQEQQLFLQPSENYEFLQFASDKIASSLHEQYPFAHGNLVLKRPKFFIQLDNADDQEEVRMNAELQKQIYEKLNIFDTTTFISKLEPTSLPIQSNYHHKVNQVPPTLPPSSVLKQNQHYYQQQQQIQQQLQQQQLRNPSQQTQRNSSKNNQSNNQRSNENSQTRVPIKRSSNSSETQKLDTDRCMKPAAAAAGERVGMLKNQKKNLSSQNEMNPMLRKKLKKSEQIEKNIAESTTVAKKNQVVSQQFNQQSLNDEKRINKRMKESNVVVDTRCEIEEDSDSSSSSQMESESNSIVLKKKLRPNRIAKQSQQQQNNATVLTRVKVEEQEESDIMKLKHEQQEQLQKQNEQIIPEEHNVISEQGKQQIHETIANSAAVQAENVIPTESKTSNSKKDCDLESNLNRKRKNPETDNQQQQQKATEQELQNIAKKKLASIRALSKKDVNSHKSNEQQCDSGDEDDDNVEEDQIEANELIEDIPEADSSKRNLNKYSNHHNHKNAKTSSKEDTHNMDCNSSSFAAAEAAHVTAAQKRMHPNAMNYIDESKRECCGCKKTKCLKLYCECFQAMRHCTNCNCNGCLNKPEFEEARQVAIEQIQMRNSTAFDSKVDKGEEIYDAANGQKIHTKGCNCKRSDCRKKYCECFQMGAKCTNLCKCLNCKNQDEYEYSSNNKHGGTGSPVPVHQLYYMEPSIQMLPAAAYRPSTSSKTLAATAAVVPPPPAMFFYQGLQPATALPLAAARASPAVLSSAVYPATVGPAYEHWGHFYPAASVEYEQSYMAAAAAAAQAAAAQHKMSKHQQKYASATSDYSNGEQSSNESSSQKARNLQSRMVHSSSKSRIMQ